MLQKPLDRKAICTGDPASGATEYTKYQTSSGCVFDELYFKIKQIQLGLFFPEATD